MKRIPSLDGLRALSISMVVVGHWLFQHRAWAVAESYALLGVRIFFVISGYLITTLLLKERARTSTIRLRDFYVRRAYRIFPAAITFMGIAFCLYWGELRWYHALAATFYVANFDSHLPWFLGHLWSLSVEEQFYFLWPGVLKKWYEHRVGILLGVIALAPVYKLSCFLLGFRSAAETTFPAVADNLAIGCLAAVLAPRVGRIKPALGWLALLAIALVPAFPPVTRYRTILLLFLLGQVMEVAIAVFLLQAVQTPYRILNARPVVWLGKISYSLYLWQQLFSWGPRHKPWYFLLGALGLAALSYHVVEQPMLRLRESRTRDEKEDATYALARAGD